MLNWIALYVGLYLFGQGGPLQNKEQVFSPTSNEVLEEARLPVFWGDPLLQGLHIGLFIALGALVAFWIIINRTTLGYEVRAVGFNPEAARYGGISVARNYFLAMAIAGVFAGLAGAIDMLGWRFSIGFSDIQSVDDRLRRDRRRAARPQHGARRRAVGARLRRARQRHRDAQHPARGVFDIPEQAGNLSLTIQALVLLFIGADILILYLWARTGQQIGVGQERRRVERGRDRRSSASGVERGESSPRYLAWAGVALGCARVLPHASAVTARSPVVPLVVGGARRRRRRDRSARGRRRRLATRGDRRHAASRDPARLARDALERRVARPGLRLVGADRRDAARGDAAHVRGARRDHLRAERRREHRPRGDAADGRVLRLPRRRQARARGGGGSSAASSRAPRSRSCTRSSRSTCARTRSSAASPSTSSRSGSPGYFFIEVYTDQGTPGDVSNIPSISIPGIEDLDFVGRGDREHAHPHLGRARVRRARRTSSSSGRRSGLRLRAVGEHPKAADTRRASRCTAIRYAAVIALGRARRPRRRLPLERDHALVQREPVGGPRVHRARCRHHRPLAAVWRLRRLPPVRVHRGARAAAARCVRRGRSLDDALPRAAVRRHAGRRRRRRRALDPTCRRWPPVRQAVAARASTGGGVGARARRCPRGGDAAGRDLPDALQRRVRAAARRVRDPGRRRARGARARARAPGRGAVTRFGCARGPPSRPRDRGPRARRRGRSAWRSRRSSRSASTAARVRRVTRLTLEERAESMSTPVARRYTTRACSTSVPASARPALRQELDFPELEERTKIRPKYLRALEDEQLRHPAGADVRQGLPALVRGGARARRAAVRGRVQLPLRGR